VIICDVNVLLLLHCIRGTGAGSGLRVSGASARVRMSERIFARLVPVTYLATGAGFLVKALS